MSSGLFNTVVETTIHLLPSNLSHLQDGIQGILGKMLMRYNAQLEGVVLAYDKIEILDQEAEIFLDRPHIHFPIRFRVLVYKPLVGSYVVGIVNQITESDHISLLVHGTFNATISAGKGMPADYEYNSDTTSWINRVTNETISVGTKVRLLILRLEQTGRFISLQCSIKDDMSGIIH